MKNNISNFIPTWRGKRGVILKRDTERLITAMKKESLECIENTGELAEWRKKRQEEYQIEANQIEKKAREWATNIYSDSTLSRCGRNPSYYPPVPQYTIPAGKRYTSDEIARIQKFQNSAFIQQSIDISAILLSTEEMDQRLGGIYMINPGLLENTVIHEADIEVITGFTHAPNNSDPETTSHVGYMVGVIISDDRKNTELSHIYVYKNSQTIQKLLDFLKELRVDNTQDLKIAQEYLRSAFPSSYL